MDNKNIMMVQYNKENKNITNDILDNNNLILIDKNEKYLLPIDYSNGGAITDLIENVNELINYKEYKKIKDDNKIDKLLIYGTLKNPLINWSYIYPYIHTNDSKTDKHSYRIPQSMNKLFGERFAMKRKLISGYNKKGEFIKNKETWLLTEQGIINAMYNNTSPFCISFQNFLLEFLHNLREQHLDVWKKNLSETKQIIIEQTERIAILEKKTFNNQNYINYKNQLSEAISTDCIDMLGDAELQELNILRNLYCKKQIDLYIVNPEYIKKPNKKPKKEKKDSEQLSSDDELFDELKKDNKKKSKKKIKQEESKIELIIDVIEYDDEFNIYNLINLKDVENTEFYFYLQNSTEIKKDKSNFNFIHTLNFHTKEHYDMFIKKISTPEYLTHIKKIYKLTYDTIISFRSNTFNKLHMAAIHEKIKKDNNITNDSKYELL